MNRSKKSILSIGITFLCVLCFKANAQLNRNDTLDWRIKLSATGSLLDGNVARLLLVNRLELAYAETLWGISTRNDYQYGTTRHNKTEDDFVSYNFLYANPVNKFYPYLMGIIETNYRRKIKFRYQLGPGLSYTIISAKNNLIRLSITGTYEHSRFGGTRFENLSDSLSNIINVWRVTGRVFGRQQVFENKLKLTSEFWWQQSVINSRNYRFYNEEIVETPISRKVSLRTSFRYTYENVRIKDLKPFDLFWTFGFAISNF